MWKVGERIKRTSPIHGEMIGTIDAITVGVNKTIYHVTWETSKTGTIQSRELGGRDDRDWMPLAGSEGQEDTVKEKVSLSPMIADAIEQDPNLTSVHTRRAYRSDLARFETWSAGQPLSRTLVEKYVQDLEERGKSPGRINRALAAIRWWARMKLDSTVAAEHMPPATMIRAITDALAVTRIPDRLRPSSIQNPGATPEEVGHLIATCRGDPSPAGARDAALFSLARSLNLKPGLLRRLRRGDLIVADTGEVHLQVTGPRGQTQVHRLREPTDNDCRGWLNLRDKVLPAADREQPLFLAINKGGRILEKGLSGEALRQVLKKRQRQADLKIGTWHQLCRAE